MIYSLILVNPKTNEDREIFVSLTAARTAEAKASPCLEAFVCEAARPDMPEGFMGTGRVREVRLH